MSFDGNIGHLSGIESPWGDAGGVVKTLEDVEQMAHTGVGWIEAGSYTLEPRVGNSPNGEKVYYHNPATGETFNSLGMPNKGMDVVEAEIPEMALIAHSHNKALVVNVAPVSIDPIIESRELVARAYEAGADAVLLNAGCPNVVTENGGRHDVLSYKTDALGAVLSGLKSITEKYRPIFLRLSPYESYQATMKAIWATQLAAVSSAIFTPNTWGGNKPLDFKDEPILQVSGGVGGKSGPATAEKSYEQLGWMIDLTDTDIVSSSGIVNAYEIQKRLKRGAVACAGTTFFYEPQRGWQEDVDKLLSDLIDLPPFPDPSGSL